MKLLKNLFRKQENPIQSYKDFWAWFQSNERKFYEIVKSRKNPEIGFFDILSSKLDELKDGYFYLAGMIDENTAELIFTPDGILKNIVFVEELVTSAPTLANWKFTALKPAMDIENVQITMEGYSFDSHNLSFYSLDNNTYPDEVDIVVVHNDYVEEDKATITNGVFIFLDNYLGELNVVTTIDSVTVISKDDAENELIPIAKLKDYLIWREKEFVEKYCGFRYDTENDSYSALEAELENGRPLIAIINRTLLEWNCKASHPWILIVEINYDGDNTNGMPDKDTYTLLNNFEEEIIIELKDFEGYLNIGRQTADNSREIYFACNEFRKPSKIMYELSKKYAGKLNLTYDIYKDKYWQSYERYRTNS